MYRSLEECLIDLEQNGHLVRVKEPIDPHLEMAAVHMRIFEQNGPALLFENVKGSPFRAVSNIFGTVERSMFIFRNEWDKVKQVIDLRNNPIGALKNPFAHLNSAMTALAALPMKSNNAPVTFQEIKISDIPQIKHWPMDGGAFVTLPQVYSEDIEKPGIMNANLGMYRVQLSGNDYVQDKEIGLHYQIHRGIGVHQTKANESGEDLKVSIFVGGPPSHTLAAVMPMPEGLTELTLAGMLNNRRFRYSYIDGYCINNEADFVITGTISKKSTKPEGPFGDHIGYYSLTHEFPLLKVHKVFARKDAIWPFTVVGRPPQEDTAFGDLIHALTGNAIPNEIPGIKEVHAVDAAGVHPLLFAVGSERYTPYSSQQRPAELLTLANHVLGKGQLSLAKYLFIAADDHIKIDTHKEAEFLSFILERVDLSRDVHFYTKTTIDTLDYTGEGLNEGSKVVIAAYGQPIRSLIQELPSGILDNQIIKNAQYILPGVIALEVNPFMSYEVVENEMKILSNTLLNITNIDKIPLFVLCDDANFASQDLKNFLWVTFTRSNPSHDIHGVNERIEHKHWACDNLIIDARTKPHHAPALIPDPVVEKNIDRFFTTGASLQKYQ